MELFSNFFDAGFGGAFVSRYLHVLFGIAWIGLLYFFNFVQVPAYAQLSDGARSEALRNLTWRALWWFRWAALATFLTGILLLVFQGQLTGDYQNTGQSYFASTQGMAISVGMLFGIAMFLNVWGVIWRNQKVVIGSARSVAEGGEANPDAPASAKKAARASRANTFFSFTMLWFMVLTAHFSGPFDRFAEDSTKGLFWAFIVILFAIVEASALGFIGGIDGPLNRLFFDDHRKTIIYGFIYLVVIYVVGFEIIIGGAG